MNKKIIKTIASLGCGLGCVGAVCATVTSLSTSKKPNKPFIIKSGNPVMTSSKTAGCKVVPDEYFNINEEYGEWRGLKDGVDIADLYAYDTIVVPSFIKDLGYRFVLPILPNTIKTIDLSNCLGLTKILDGAFYYQQYIETIYLPSSIELIGDRAFKTCLKLSWINLLWSSITSIGKEVFKDCRSLTRVSLSPNVKTISDYAFYGCTSLQLVDFFRPSVTSIGKYSFANCEQLKSIEIPATVKTIDDYAFSNCKNLEKVKYLGSVDSISKTAFANSDKINK